MSDQMWVVLLLAVAIVNLGFVALNAARQAPVPLTALNALAAAFAAFLVGTYVS